jgi:hypothetical protein
VSVSIRRPSGAVPLTADRITPRMWRGNPAVFRRSPASRPRAWGRHGAGDGGYENVPTVTPTCVGTPRNRGDVFVSTVLSRPRAWGRHVHRLRAAIQGARSPRLIMTNRPTRWCFGPRPCRTRRAKCVRSNPASSAAAGDVNSWSGSTSGERLRGRFAMAWNLASRPKCGVHGRSS